MEKAELLVMLEADLELILDYYDDEAKAAKEAELSVYLESAQTYITREGITLNLEEIGDCLLVVMYAAWLYRKRQSADTRMPRMLRYNLNNRLFAEKAKVEG